MIAPAIKFTVSMKDYGLQDTIVQVARAAGRTVKEQTRLVMKYMVRIGLQINPPGSAGVSGKNSQRAGEGAIMRDVNRIGFVPVQIKGFRMQTVAFGRKIKPVKVMAHGKFLKEELPSQESVDALHRLRLTRKHGARVTQGRAKPYWVRKSYLTALRIRLFKEVGMLSSWLIPAARTLGVAIPAWIARHAGSGRGTELQVIETENKISMRVVGHFPDTAAAEADETQRRLDAQKQYAVNNLKRQLPFLLKRSARAAKRTV
jgi:hypothetical protein